MMNCYIVEYTHPRDKTIYFKIFAQSLEDCYGLLVQYLSREDLGRYDLVIKTLIEDKKLSDHECVKETLKLMLNNFKEIPTQLFLDVTKAERFKVDDSHNQGMVIELGTKTHLHMTFYN